MWLKQFSWFDMQSPLLLSNEALLEALENKQAYKPHATQSKSIGWVSPLGEEQPLVITQGNYLWMRARIDQKLLPQTVVNEVLLEKMAEQEAMQGYPPTSKQRKLLKEDITLDLLPKAFIVSKYINVMIDTQNQLLILDTTSANIKDSVIDLLRQTVGSLPLTHYIESRLSTSQILKSWITNPPEGIHIESEYTLIHPNDVSAKARLIGLDETDIIGHLDKGMTISQLLVSYQDQVTFQINDQVDISKLKFITLQDDEKLEDPIAQIMSDFALTAPYCSQIILACKSWFQLTQEKEDVSEVA